MDGSIPLSMSPTVTGATMPILTNTSAVRLAKKLLPHYWFRLTNLRFQSVAIYPNITHVTLIIVMR